MPVCTIVHWAVDRDRTWGLAEGRSTDFSVLVCALSRLSLRAPVFREGACRAGIDPGSLRPTPVKPGEEAVTSAVG